MTKVGRRNRRLAYSRGVENDDEHNHDALGGRIFGHILTPKCQHLSGSSCVDMNENNMAARNYGDKTMNSLETEEQMSMATGNTVCKFKATGTKTSNASKGHNLTTPGQRSPRSLVVRTERCGERGRRANGEMMRCW